MSTAAKRKLVVGLLAAMAVWPAVHHLMAVRYAFDPWRFFGWSMYAVPDSRVQVQVAELAGRELRVLDPPPEAVGVYAFERAVFGRLLPPDELAMELLAGRPAASGLVIRVRRLVLDPETARIVAEDEIHRYGRDGPVRQ